jgi:hypothetical protein
MNRAVVLLLAVATSGFLACSAGGADEGPSGCEPECTGRECGTDGCGGTCGTCSTGTCLAGSCCFPDCTGRICGSDGCGGSCGECGDRGEDCNVNGQCEPLNGIGDTCTSNGGCTPGLVCRTDRAFADAVPTFGNCLACMTLAGQCDIDADCCSGICVPGAGATSAGPRYCAVTRYESCRPHGGALGECCSGEESTISGGIGGGPYICVGCGSKDASPCRTGLDCCSGVCDFSTHWCR